MGDMEVHKLAHHVFDLLYSRITEFQYFATVYTNDVIMLFESIRLFILSNIFAELMPLDEIGIDQEFQCIIYSRSAYPVILIFHLNIKSFCIEMVIPIVYFFQNRISLGGLAYFVFFQMGSENLFHLLVFFFVFFFWQHMILHDLFISFSIPYPIHFFPGSTDGVELFG